MYYFIGDVHGYIKPLVHLIQKIEHIISAGDTIVFLGDYIDRGDHSYEVIDFLISLYRSNEFNTVFLRGNHEQMLEEYLNGQDQYGRYMLNGGAATKQSYIRNRSAFSLPAHHRRFFDNLQLYYEGEDFIAVHAGLNPIINSVHEQDKDDLLWIRDKFYRSNRKWEKTVIFGHTPALMLSAGEQFYIDTERNIIGIDSGVIYGRQLLGLSWPDRKIIK